MQNLHQQWFGGPGYYYSLPIPAFGDKGSSWQYWTLENTVQGGRLLLYPIVHVGHVYFAYTKYHFQHSNAKRGRQHGTDDGGLYVGLVTNGSTLWMWVGDDKQINE